VRIHWLQLHPELDGGDAGISRNLDKLTYAGNPENLKSVASSNRYAFVHAGIEDSGVVSKLLREHSIRGVINFAAESNVDRSILGPEAFQDLPLTELRSSDHPPYRGFGHEQRSPRGAIRDS
jgi:hypothetical protein